MTDDQLISKLRKVIREQVKLEAEKSRSDMRMNRIETDGSLRNLNNTLKDLAISGKRLEKGQEEQGKELKAIKKVVKRIDKTLSITIKMFDERIVDNTKRIDRIEDELSLPPLKH